MKKVSGWLIGNQTHLAQKNMLWNMIGSAVYSLASMMLGAAVTRILGADLGGIFFFAFSTFGQQMFIVSYFGIRPIQVTDTNERFSFGEYRQFRIYTCILAIIPGICYTMLPGIDSVKKWVVLAMVCYKVIDGFADVYESEFQRNGRLYLAGKSNTFRTLLSIGAFLAILVVTNNLIFSSIIAVAAQMLGFVLLNQGVINQLQGINYSVEKNKLKSLWNDSKWLFLSAFLDLYIFSSSKYAIDAHLEPSASTYFGTIFIPTSVINLAAGFVIRPFLTMMSERWEKRQYQEFWQVIYRITAVIAGMTVIALLMAYWLGIPVLSLLLGKTAGAGLAPYKMALLINIAGGGFYAFLNLLYYVLVIMNDQKSIFGIYGIGSLLAVVLSPIMVKNYGIIGGAISYLILMVMISLMFAMIVMKIYRRRNRS